MRALFTSTLFLLLTMLSFPASGQKVWHWFVDLITKGDEFDSTYIYQRPAHFAVDMSYDIQNFSVDMNGNYKRTMEERDADGNVTATAQVPVQMEMDFAGKMKSGAGIGASYGGLALGYGFNIGRGDDKGSNTFNLAYRGHKWGIGVNYYGLNHYAHNEVTYATDTSRWYSHTELTSNSPCDVYRLAVDAYWSVRRRAFAYTAAYKCDMLQRRSAGSLIICANLLFSGMQCQPGDEIFLSSGMQSYSFMQASAGAGYSHNIVFLHRDPTGPNYQGLRNLTLNLTLLPMLTFRNSFTTRPADGSDDVKVTCPVGPSANSSIALGYSIGRIYAGLQYSHVFYYFTSGEDLKPEDLHLQDRPISDLAFNVLMQNWKVMAMVVVNI